MTDHKHLKRRGNVYWLKLAIPHSIRHLYLTRSGKHATHVEETLHTGDLREANRKKYARVAFWQADFARKRAQEAGNLPPDIVDAYKWRDAIQQADSDTEREALEGLAIDRAEQIEVKAGTDAAQRWYKLATHVERPTLRSAFDDWMRVSEYTAATKAKYRAAFDELLLFMDRGDAMPDDVTPERARSYVQWLNTEATSQRGGPLSHATKHGRMVALSSFWVEHLEHNEHVPKGSNPWTGQKITGARKPRDGEAGAKRPYTDAEIVALLDGPELREVGTTYTRRTLLELYALGFYTGARLDELCSLTLSDVQRVRGGYEVRVGQAKSWAGVRSLPVTNALPVAVITRRINKRKDPAAFLFAELVRGGPDDKRSWQVQKALGRYRQRVGLGTETDFHSTRRSLLTRLLTLEVPMEQAAVYAGHKLPGLTYGVYGRVTPEVLRKVAQRVTYPKRIEQALGRELGLK